jgi:hypothetical protein
MKSRYEWRELLTRCLFLAAGMVAAILLALTGQLEALPGLALGGTLGACFVTRALAEN